MEVLFNLTNKTKIAKKKTRNLTLMKTAQCTKTSHLATSSVSNNSANDIWCPWVIIIIIISIIIVIIVSIIIVIVVVVVLIIIIIIMIIIIIIIITIITTIIIIITIIIITFQIVS